MEKFNVTTSIRDAHGQRKPVIWTFADRDGAERLAEERKTSVEVVHARQPWSPSGEEE